MFENTLIESEHHAGGSKKALSFPVSVLIHALVIGIALGASIWFVGEVPEPPIPVTFYAAAPPPPPPIVEEERDRSRWWLWVLIALALLAIAVGLYLTLKPEQLTVPDVIDRESATASQILQNRGFEVDIDWRAGRLTGAAVRSLLGRLCRLRAAVPLRLSGPADGRSSWTTPENGMIEFPTVPGGSYTIAGPGPEK